MNFGRPFTWKQCRLMAIVCVCCSLITLLMTAAFDSEYENPLRVFLLFLTAVYVLIAVIFFISASNKCKEEEKNTGPRYFTIDDDGNFVVKSAEELAEKRVEMQINSDEDAQQALKRIEELYREDRISVEDFTRVRAQLLGFLNRSSNHGG